MSHAASSPSLQDRRRPHISFTALAWKRNRILVSLATPLSRLRGVVHRTTCILLRKKPHPWGVSETAIPQQIPSSPPPPNPKTWLISICTYSGKWNDSKGFVLVECSHVHYFVNMRPGVIDQCLQF